MPHGDGQKIRLRAASNGRFYQNYSLSFEEPWMGVGVSQIVFLHQYGKQFKISVK